MAKDAAEQMVFVKAKIDGVSTTIKLPVALAQKIAEAYKKQRRQRQSKKAKHGRT